MTEFYAPVAIGTAATLLATVLLLLRANFQGHRPVVTLTRRWVAASAHTSSLVLALLFAIAVSCFANIPEMEGRKFGGASALSGFSGAAVQGEGINSDESSSAAHALESLRAYAGNIDSKQESIAATSSPPDSVELPDVDVMIAKLFARLEKNPDDVKGWKMLGWSYLNTDRPAEAQRAYETALRLEPSDNEITKGLEAAKSAQTATTRIPSSDPATSPTAKDIRTSEGLSDNQRDSMIRGMVDKLASRLETSPNDEEGWLRLMRSRMTLGEKDAAKAALTKALETFAADAAAKGRLTAAARELGVESN
jgi:cytochrome c-type biogenesis protein CcmH